jgi:serine/threonine-protein kinase
MATVYKAVDLAPQRPGRTVAIKRLLPEYAADPTYLSRFLHEAALCQQLTHPNIVSVYESGELEGIHYIAMEYVDGRDLAQILRRCKELEVQLPVDFAVYLARMLLEALDGAHRACGSDGRPLGIVHCDVSPSNLFISRTGEIKLGDFGIARSADAGASLDLVEGKPSYISPEVLDGRITAQADLWAAAATLYELLTLQKPFKGASPSEVFAAILSARHAPVRKLRPEVSKPLSALVDRALSKHPGKRFQTAAEFSEALRPQYDERIGTPLAIAALVRGMFG